MRLFGTRRDNDGFPVEFHKLADEILERPSRYTGTKYVEALNKACALAEELDKNGQLKGSNNFEDDNTEVCLYLKCLGKLYPCYRNGYDCKQDYVVALKYLNIRKEVIEKYLEKNELSRERLTIANNTYLFLGEHYINGWGCEKNVSRAKQMYQRGFEIALASLEKDDGSNKRSIINDLVDYVNRLMEGVSMPVDIEISKKMIDQLMSHQIIAGYHLAENLFYLKFIDYKNLGQSIEKNIEIYEKHSQNPYAKYMLGLIYYQGEEDKYKGLSYLKEAGEELYFAAHKLFSIHTIDKNFKSRSSADYWKKQFYKIEKRNIRKYSNRK